MFLCVPAVSESLAVVVVPGSPFLAPAQKRPAVPSLGSSPAACAHSHPPVSSAPPATRGALSTLHPTNTHVKGHRKGKTQLQYPKQGEKLGTLFGNFTIFV